MTVRTYKSTDASAPVLTGQAGSLNDLLQAVLVDGYGAITAAGWTREFNDTGSKTMVWRPASGPRHYFQSQDNGPGAGTYKESRLRGYVSMSAYNTGTEPFPTAAQSTNGMFVRKSTTLDATARAWSAVADDQTIHLFIESGDTANNVTMYTFGAFASWKASDAYASIVAARVTENSTGQTTTLNPNMAVEPSGSSTTVGYAPRSYTAVGTSQALCQKTNATLMKITTSQSIGGAGETYPNPVDGGILVAPIYLAEGSIIRGQHRGLWNPCHVKPIIDGDTFSASDGATTRTFVAKNLFTAAQAFVETTNTWDTP